MSETNFLNSLSFNIFSATVPHEASQLAKVWHFPIKVTVENNNVYYSVTCTTQNVGSIDDLMEYHRTRPLKGEALTIISVL